jgi:hypothetical protein
MTDFQPLNPLYVEKFQQAYWVTYPDMEYKRIEYFINHFKLFKMKKLLAVTLVSILAACGSGSSTSTTDSTTVKTDSSTTTVTDSSGTRTDSTHRASDTTKMKMDSTKK